MGGIDFTTGCFFEQMEHSFICEGMDQKLCVFLVLPTQRLNLVASEAFGSQYAKNIYFGIFSALIFIFLILFLGHAQMLFICLGLLLDL